MRVTIVGRFHEWWGDCGELEMANLWVRFLSIARRNKK